MSNLLWSTSFRRKRERIVYKELIKKGSYAEVWRAEWRDNKGREMMVAAKRIDKAFFDKKEYRQEVISYYVGKFSKEWEILQKLDHPNIVKLFKFGFEPPTILMELMHCDLRNYIEKSTTTPKVSPDKVLSIALGVAEGLKCLHGLPDPIVHRDLTSKKILLTETDHPKIAGFGVFPKDVSTTAGVRTPLYAAPETQLVAASERAMYGPSVDIFSFGVVLMEMCVGHEPRVLPVPGIFPETRRRLEDLDEMEEGKLKKLVIKCLQDKSPKRPSASKLVTRLKKVEPQRVPTFVGFLSPREERTNDYEFKVLFLGNHNVGKSTLIGKLRNLEYDIDTHPKTKASLPGIDTLEHYYNYDGKAIKMLVVDTSGEERFFCLTASYYRDVDGVFLVYDISDKVSLRSLPFWITSLRKYNSKDDLQMLLVGNKVDLRQTADADDLVPPGRAIEFASNINSPYVETSARDDESVKEMYQKMVKILMSTVSPEDADVQVKEKAGTTLRLPSPESQNNPEELSRWSSIKFRNKCKA